MKTYSDPISKISFQYPTVWTFSHRNNFWIPPAINPLSELSQAIVTFSPAGNTYANTNLSGLEFTYRRIVEPSLAACVAKVREQANNLTEEPSFVTIRGVLSKHLAAGGATAMKQVDQQVYLTRRDGFCYLFEEDLHTISAGIVDGERELTVAEHRALKRHLHGVMESVEFGR